ncbi:helix-turn-helix domain-containing protein [Actinocorallia sp. API 0066]|uniref:GlxA family transcriptional regulator n=1 Tax=Actinocorallia sp. API 0066 TaxID=2896846 RepID=UPI001E6253FF|nr:helix-turn-helix domain-containing protein [Actinocorallia sp. API 0066]MCD0448882.1 helix-turn-helix domain-containing protein [Actinocorallia sp. API 0066]
MRHRVVALVGPYQELYPVTCASAVFGYHGTDIPQLYEFRVCAERPGLQSTTLGADIVVRDGLEALAEADTILLASWWRWPPEDVLTAVRAAHARGARIITVWAGVFVPAALGLLDGLRTAVHWDLAGELSRRFPRVRPDASVLYIDHGDVVTAGASATVIDVCLHLVRRDHGAALALRIGRQIAAAPHREGRQRQYPDLPTQGPAPDGLAPLLEWITENLERPLTVEDMAERAGTSARTLSRRFADRLGVSPGRWLLERRIAHARALLEETDLPVETIARRTGLATSANFRRRFRAAVGTTPSAYRHGHRGLGQSSSAPG